MAVCHEKCLTCIATWWRRLATEMVAMSPTMPGYIFSHVRVMACFVDLLDMYTPRSKPVWNAQYLKSGLRRRRVLRAGNVIIRLLCYVGASDKVYLVTDLRN